MAATIAQSAPFGARTVLNLVNGFDRMVQAVARWNAERQTRILLLSLSDDILADIGAERPYKI